jgi:hypothetical protein
MKCGLIPPLHRFSRNRDSLRLLLYICTAQNFMMDYTQTAEQLSCPCCKRDYEVPRRYLIQLGDYDFSPIPRLLPCLHTLCHSCLQDQFEKSDKGIIECYLCKHSEPIKGVGYLPFDISVLKQIVNLTSAEIMAVCSRCYDAIPSVSWCATCSSALCEFHHQDHRLSIDTAKHAVNTFKEALHSGQHLHFTFPPLACPECPMQDCDLYCHTCGYLVSPKAGIQTSIYHSALVPKGNMLVLTSLMSF